MLQVAPQIRVLIVDDDEVSRELLAILLEAEGYGVESADSGDAAVRAMEGRGGNLPNAVLADMQMPGLTGGALAVMLRSLCGAETRLLAMSGSQPKPEAMEPFDGFLLKPFGMEELADVLGGGERAAGMPVEVEAGTTLDDRTYRELSEMMRPEQMQELYDMGLRDAATHITAMRAAGGAGNVADFQRRAHAMKGSFGMLGARDLQTAAAEMETRGPDATTYMATLDRFELAIRTLRRILMSRGLSLDSAGGLGDVDK